MILARQRGGKAIVSLTDPAIDPATTKEALEEYAKDFDIRHLTFKDGEKPTLFHVRPLKIGERARIMDEAHYTKDGVWRFDQHQAMVEVARSCVEKIENGPEKIDDVPYAVVQEIGGAVSIISNLSEADRKN